MRSVAARGVVVIDRMLLVESNVMTQFRKPKLKTIFLLLGPVVLLTGIGIISRRKEAIVEPRNQQIETVIPVIQIEAVIKKVVLKRFVCRNPSSGFAGTHSYLKITAFAGYQGARPEWWGRYGADMDFENIHFIDKDGGTHHLSSSSGGAIFNSSTELYSRSCDVPMNNGRFFIDGQWKSGYTDNEWDKGGTLKCTIRIRGFGWLYDAQGQLVRNSKGDAVRVVFNGEIPFVSKIKVK